MRWRNHERGQIVRKHSLVCYDVQIPGRPYPWEGVYTLNPQHFRSGEVVTLGFLEGNRQLPVVLNQKPWPTSARIVKNLSPLILTPWRRVGVTRGLRYWLESEGNDYSQAAALLLGGANPGAALQIVRTDNDGALVRASGGNLIHDESSEALGQEIQALSVGIHTGRIYAMVLLAQGVGDWQEGWDDGLELMVSLEETVIQQGRDDCDQFGPESHEGWWPGPGALEAFQAANPPAKGGDYVFGWTEALHAGFTDYYMRGWSENCEERWDYDPL